MVIVSKKEVELIKKHFPHAHFSYTVNKTMVDEVPAILRLLTDNVEAQRSLLEWEKFEKERNAMYGNGNEV